MPDLTRRSVVRAGVGAVWVAPVVTLATSAPASAAGSTTFAFTGLTAGYRNFGDPTSVLPHLVDVTAVLVDEGPAGPLEHGVTLTIPPGVSDEEPLATSEGGFVALPAVQSTEEETLGFWVLQFTRSAAKSAGSSTVPFMTTITLGSTTTAPFLGYRGRGFALLATASSNGGTTQPGQAQVDPTFDSELDPSLSYFMQVSSPDPEADPPVAGVIAVWANSILVAGDASRSSIGQLSLTLRLPRLEGSPFWPTPLVSAVDGGWHLDSITDVESHWELTFTTSGTGFTGILGHEDTRGPGHFEAMITLGAPGEVPEFSLEWWFTADHLVTVGHTTSYPDVIIGGS